LVASFLAALGIGCWYFMKKHWIANNIFGLAFAVNGIEFLQLNKILNGFILLGGLFFYDVFWVIF
jgi:minor histocompatibility antigen H13